jgi:hypothetical protein
MALIINERVIIDQATLELGEHALPVHCQVTVEWLKGISEPTWYGFLKVLSPSVEILPGQYTLRVAGAQTQILLRRPARGAAEAAYPFWGVGAPPAE